MLRLRPYKRTDSEALLSWLSDERTVELWKADRFTWPLTSGQFEQYFVDFEQDPAACQFTTLDESGALAGHFSFREIDYEKNSAHMGFIVVDPQARGKGYGRQMVTLALQYAFEILGLKRVTLGVYDCNLAARNCYDSVGFKEIPREHKKTEFHGERWEYYYLAAERDESLE